MRKYLWIAVIALITSAVYFTSCERIPQEMMETIMPDAEQIEPPPEMIEEMPPEMVEEMPVDLVDVLIYTNRSFWITLEDAEMAAETTKRLLDAAGVQAEITKDDAYVREWMLHTTGDGNTNAIVLYGVLPASVYGTGNTQPDGSIAENWIETTDGDTILNHADYIAFNTDFDVDKVTEWTPDNAHQAVGSNREDGLQNLMDNPNINLFTAFRADGGASMTVTSDGMTLTPSLSNFDSLRPIPLAQLQGEWFAEKVFASDTGDAEATYADPVILRDGDRGRLAIVHATTEHAGLLNGEVAAEMIINALLAPPMVETTPEPPTETVVETPPETVVETPPETTDLSGGMLDIEDAMSTIGLRKIYWTDDDSLLRANPDGSGVETLFDRRPDLEPTFDVRKLVVDSEGGKIYWNGDESADRGGGMWRANLDGTNLERLTTIQTRGFALDLEAGKIYWVTYDGDHMFQRSNLDGSGVEKFNTQAIFGQPPSVIEFDPVDRKIYAYLFDYTGVSVINTDDLDIEAADIEFQVPIPTSAYTNLTLDIEERKIYWVTDYSGIYRINLDGTGYELVMDEGRIAATFDFNTRKIYWGKGQVIWQANLDGSEREALFAVEAISGIAVETGPIN